MNHEDEQIIIANADQIFLRLLMWCAILLGAGSLVAAEPGHLGQPLPNVLRGLAAAAQGAGFGLGLWALYVADRRLSATRLLERADK